MTVKVSLFFFLFLFNTATADKKAAVSSLPPPLRYKKAMEEPSSVKSCAIFSDLSKQNLAILGPLVELRKTQYCEKKSDWKALEKKISLDVLKPVFHRAQFEALMSGRKIKQAYRLFSRHRNDIKLDNDQFDKLALKALKTSLTKKEKAQLRDELWRKSPRYLPRPKKNQYLKVAKDFRKDRQFEKALYYYRQVINDPKMGYHKRWKGFQGARITYKLERWSRMKKYIRASRQWADFLSRKYKWSKEMTRLHHNANIEYVRTLWTERGQKPALVRLNKLERQLRGRYSLQMVYWLKGKMAEEKGHYKEAVRLLVLASKEKRISQRDLDRILWALAWNQRRTQKFAESQKNLGKLLKSSELTFFSKTKYLYWQAINWDSMGEKKKSLEAFDYLSQLDPYGYYGALAFRQRKVPFPEPPRNQVSQEKVLGFFSQPDRALFLAFREAGELELTEALLKKRVQTKKSWGAEDWAAYLSLMQEAGAYRGFFVQYHSLPPKTQLSLLEKYPSLLFPQPYQEVVSDSSRLTQVSSSLIYSIMKQESGFDVKARSHADAFGLLQLIPQVAKKAAQRVPSVSYKNPYDLYKPEVIIPLGADNLRYLFTRFKSNFILSVASYNASEQAVRNWVKTRFKGDPVQFIEDIPYEETKGYVKLVMRNYITYNRFQNESENFLFPEVCLQGLQAFKGP